MNMKKKERQECLTRRVRVSWHKAPVLASGSAARGFRSVLSGSHVGKATWTSGILFAPILFLATLTPLGAGILLLGLGLLVGLWCIRLRLGRLVGTTTATTNPDTLGGSDVNIRRCSWTRRRILFETGAMDPC